MAYPCLPVSRRRKRDHEDAVSFHDIESMDASDYLSRVVDQASQLPAVLSAPVTRKLKAAQSKEWADAMARLLDTPHRPPTLEHAAKREWVDETLENFGRLRAYLADCEEKGIGGKGTNRIPVPTMKDRTGWNQFCLGSEFAQAIDSDVNTDRDPMTPSWKQDLPETGYTPTVSRLCQMDQVMVRRIIPHLALAVETLTQNRTAWLYALFARLERPLHRDDAAVMYAFLKKLTARRAEIDPAEQGDELSRVNLLIVVVGMDFQQGGGYDNLMGVEGG